MTLKRLIRIATGLALACTLPTGPVYAGPLAVENSGFSTEDIQRVRAVTRPAQDFSKAEAHEAMQGGAGTAVGADDLNAFTHFELTLDAAAIERFKLGNALFKKLWVSAPSSTQASDGLGPLFNARSCQTCHLHDGRGHPPEGESPSASFFFRLARTPQTAAEKDEIASYKRLNFPDPVYGAQFQDLAVPGLAGEGTVGVTYESRPVVLAGGETVELRVPHYAVNKLNYGPLDPATTLSPRIAQSLPGMGLLEAIPESEILAHADADDKNGDGISGRANFVREERTGKLMLGRFGWKAQNPTVRDQAASALSGDIGISSPDRPDPYGDCTAAETACRKMPNGVQARLGDTEAPDPILDLLTAYTQSVAVPERRDEGDPQVLAGKAQFYKAGCADCHTPKFVTGRNVTDQQHAFQLIWPYSDLLLHDMGADLADGQQVGEASGREWRTAPLWAIGLTRVVNGREAYLHDGRARTLEEAILWHGGEAKKARDTYASLQRQDRQSLLRFLESL
jgi:CxxC motif-containing protein (DUF1111 family)